MAAKKGAATPSNLEQTSECCSIMASLLLWASIKDAGTGRAGSGAPEDRLMGIFFSRTYSIQQNVVL